MSSFILTIFGGFILFFCRWSPSTTSWTQSSIPRVAATTQNQSLGDIFFYTYIFPLCSMFYYVNDTRHGYRVQKITGKSCAFHKVDLLDKEALRQVFRQAGHDKWKANLWYLLALTQQNNPCFCILCNLIQVCHKKTIQAFMLFRQRGIQTGSGDRQNITNKRKLRKTIPRSCH